MPAGTARLAACDPALFNATTRSPTASPSTSAATSLTVPALAYPTMCGTAGGGTLARARRSPPSTLIASAGRSVGRVQHRGEDRRDGRDRDRLELGDRPPERRGREALPHHDLAADHHRDDTGERCFERGIHPDGAARQAASSAMSSSGSIIPTRSRSAAPARSPGRAVEAMSANQHPLGPRRSAV